ncbi:Uma2 family endonuclease [Streptomyces sp. NPDC050263]|uniref:Uma2 family endonuclease n=1 Tax=Streptomyces sp. NPDC050263 TaxID=3155037 RepID=UPI00344AE0E9
MSAHFGDYVLTDDDWDEAVWVWRHTVVPKGCRAEIIDGLVTVMPLTAGAGHGIAQSLTRGLYEVIPENWGVYQWLATAVPARLGLYVPDLVVLPREPMGVAGDDFVPAAAARLVVEITSQATADNDRVRKAAGYAQAGVPLYLLVDGVAPGGPTVTLYGEPADGTYRLLSARPFGEVIELPEPFAYALDTAGFPAPMS